MKQQASVNMRLVTGIENVQKMHKHTYSRVNEVFIMYNGAV